MRLGIGLRYERMRAEHEREVTVSGIGWLETVHKASVEDKLQRHGVS